MILKHLLEVIGCLKEDFHSNAFTQRLKYQKRCFSIQTQSLATLLDSAYLKNGDTLHREMKLLAGVVIVLLKLTMLIFQQTVQLDGQILLQQEPERVNLKAIQS